MASVISNVRRYHKSDDIDLGDELKITTADDQLNKQKVCLLSIRVDRWTIEWLRTELYNRCLIFHPHILKIYDIFVYHGDELEVVFEHPRGPNLLNFLESFKATESFVRNLFQQIVFAMECYHEMGIKGIDLTMEKVTYNFEHGVIKMVDFGFCKREADDSYTVSLPYVAPEQLNSSSKACQLNERTDVWRCGVLLYCMLFRSFPFCPEKNTTRRDHVLNIMRGNWDIPIGKISSGECVDLLSKLLAPNPEKRITLSEIKQHPWYLTDLPEGVLKYEHLKRPKDGLPEKLKALMDCRMYSNGFTRWYQGFQI